MQGLVEAGVRLPDELFVADHLVHGLPASLLQDNDEEVDKRITNLALRAYEESSKLLAQRGVQGVAARRWT